VRNGVLIIIMRINKERIHIKREEKKYTETFGKEFDSEDK
jgi:hypothetical protein